MASPPYISRSYHPFHGYLSDSYCLGLDLDAYLGEDSGAVWEPAELDPCSYYIQINYLEVTKGEVQGREEVEAPLSPDGPRKPIIPVEDRDAILRYLKRTAIKKPVHENNGFRSSEPRDQPLKPLRSEISDEISDELFTLTWNSFATIPEIAKALHLSRIAVEYYAGKLGLGLPGSLENKTRPLWERKQEARNAAVRKSEGYELRNCTRTWNRFCCQWRVVGGLMARNSKSKFQVQASFPNHTCCPVKGCGAMVGTTFSKILEATVVRMHSVGFAAIRHGHPKCAGSYVLALES